MGLEEWMRDIVVCYKIFLGMLSTSRLGPGKKTLSSLIDKSSRE